jgi:hypothetical protein
MSSAADENKHIQEVRALLGEDWYADYQANKPRLDYLGEYARLAKQLAEPFFGNQWYAAGTPVEIAAAWASLGYPLREAAPLIASGMFPNLVAAAGGKRSARRARGTGH